MTSKTPRQAGEQGEETFQAIGPDQRASGIPKIFWEVVGRWYLPCLGAVTGLFLSVYYIKKTPEQFDSTATLLVKQNVSRVMSREELEDIDMRSDDAMNTIAAQVTRVELIERVARRPEFADRQNLVRRSPGYLPDWLERFFGQGPEGGRAESAGRDPTEGEVVAFLQNRLKVSVRRRTRLLDITVSHEDAELAKALADGFAEEYLVELGEESRGSQDLRSKGLIDQADEARKSLQEANSALAVYKRALAAHAELEAEEEEGMTLARRYREKHPKMIAALAQLTAAREKFLEEFRVASTSEADKDYWEEAQDERGAVEGNSEAELEIARRLLLARTQVLDGETKSRTSVFNSILVALEEAKVNSIEDEVIADLHSRALVPERAAFPNRMRVYAAGGLGGVACGVGLVLLLLRIDNRFRTVSQTEEETGHPVLAAVPVLSEKRLAAAEQSSRQGKGKGEHEDVGEGADYSSRWVPDIVFRPGLQSSLYAESYRVLRAAVTLLGDEKERRISLFFSALPGEGKTTTSINFALATASQGRKTLLLDMDLRKPRVHRQFGRRRSEQGKGMAEILSRQCSPEEVLCRDLGPENLDAIFAGGKARNPGELLKPGAIRELLEWAREHYDHVVIDTAPVLAVPDTRIILPLVDNPCLVVRANTVPKPAVFRALDLVEEGGVKLSGIVLNGYRESRRLLGYNYSYGAYRTGRYGYRQYGYGGYGSYGAYGSDDEED